MRDIFFPSLKKENHNICILPQYRIQLKPRKFLCFSCCLQLKANGVSLDLLVIMKKIKVLLCKAINAHKI